MGESVSQIRFEDLFSRGKRQSPLKTLDGLLPSILTEANQPQIVERFCTPGIDAKRLYQMRLGVCQLARLGKDQTQVDMSCFVGRIDLKKPAKILLSLGIPPETDQQYPSADKGSGQLRIEQQRLSEKIKSPGGRRLS